MNRKEHLLIFTLGRETTPYEAAIVFRSEKDKVGLGEFGAWYTCKKQLLREGYVVEVGKEEKKKLIKANVTRYLEDVLKDLPKKNTFEKENLPLFEKYVSRIVNFLIKEKILEDYDVNYPFVFFLFARLLSTVGRHFPTSTKINSIDRVHMFVKNLSEIEKQELRLKDARQEVMESLFTIVPADSFKEILVHFGAKMFDAAIFNIEQFDRALNLIAALKTEEDVKFFRDALEDYEQRKSAKADELQKEHDAEILEKNPCTMSPEDWRKSKEAFEKKTGMTLKEALKNKK